jgi:predicted type IV restriction endonuclease
VDGINPFKPVIGVKFREELMNEADTRAELIDRALKAAGWGVVGAANRPMLHTIV